MSTQTDLKSDDWCFYNQSAAPLEWILQKGQYNNTFATGTIGINAASNYVRPDIVNIDSYLSGRDDILSKCNPPVPMIDEANEAPLVYQNEKNNNLLQPLYTREKASSVNLAAISYIPLTFEPDLPAPPQDLNHIIFNEPQRGGLNTSNLIRNAWGSDAMEYFLDPQRFCGSDCSEVNGAMSRMPYSKDRPEAEWGRLPQGLPSSQWAAPNTTWTQPIRSFPAQPTSQMLVSLGVSPAGPQQVVPTRVVDPNDKRNLFMSNNVLPQESNPYNPPPQVKDPVTGKYYFSNPLKRLIPS